ncbi:hypothetical protein PJIAN_2255 [Paludibacter jiangxiensis]|uniref:Uncharacterized protein n=1 Tax=Paludibacter jiangxiensis TaxID=681398 RepID=A0A161LE22_9BACT|nr:hypothetical protein PJIAN_2255 [Paludibacter jiangxiensis]
MNIINLINMREKIIHLLVQICIFTESISKKTYFSISK